jgi:ornithine cyclodeaminase/alanine dehydrogenase-like protein (mu-crystallin family)
MVLLLSEADVARAISMNDAIDRLEDVFRQYAQGAALVTPRTSAQIPRGGGAFRVMSAILPESGFFGLKSLTGYPGRRLPGETYFVILLFSCETGALRAVIAANQLTGIRTGAATGLAARYLARPQSHVAGIFGAGVQARYQVAALKAVCPVEELRVFDPDPAKAAAFAQEMADEFDVRPVVVDQARDAVVGCDLIVAATSAPAPVFDGAWLEEGTHVSGIGANSPAKKELDALTFGRSHKVVVDFREQVLEEAGDLRHAIESGTMTEGAIHADLAQLAAGQKSGRDNEREITLFKSVGVALEDIATAAFVYEQAFAQGLGEELDLLGDERVAGKADSRRRVSRGNSVSA